MSTKGSKRTSRRSLESEPEFKVPEAEPVKNGSQEEVLVGFADSEVAVVVEVSDAAKEINESKVVTRSQSASPQVKKGEEEPAEEAEVQKESEKVAVNGNCENENQKCNGNGTESNDTEHSEMDSLIVEPDEPEPELQFDDTSDLESGKNSPVISRCKTRRSQLRNIPTPKTPKSVSVEQPDEPEKNVTPLPDEEETPKPTELDESKDSSVDDNLSTKVEVGSDATRINFTEELNSPFLTIAKEKTFSESMRLISSRRSVRSVDRQLPQRSELNLPYPERASVETLAGTKRKNRSETPDEPKRYKTETSGILSYIKSPMSNIRSRFGGYVASSTPKLTGFKSRQFDGTETGTRAVQNGPEKKWCSIM